MKKFLLKFLLTTFFIMPFFNMLIYNNYYLSTSVAISSDFLSVSNSDSDSTSVSSSNSDNSFPTINARHAIIFDRNSKLTIYGKKESEKCKMASTTKIMTAILTLENANLDDIVTVSSRTARAPKSRIGLSTDDKISVRDLLYGLMLYSGNDAAVALAEYVGGSVEDFAIMMNNKATDLEMLNSHFVTPNGLDNDDHYSTALDLAILADYAFQNEDFSKIVKTKSYSISINGNFKTISNTHELLGNLEGVYGGKTGFTNGANRCLITGCKRGDLDIICVVLGCDTKKDRTKDSINLINYTFDNYSLVNINEIINTNFEQWKLLHSTSFSINKGISSIIDLYIDQSSIPFSYMAINNSQIDNIETKISFDTYFEAPLSKDSSIGLLTLRVNDIEYFSINIKNSNEIPKKGIYDYMLYIFSNYSKILVRLIKSLISKKRQYILLSLFTLLFNPVFIFCKHFLFDKFRKFITFIILKPAFS